MLNVKFLIENRIRIALIIIFFLIKLTFQINKVGDGVEEQV